MGDPNGNGGPSILIALGGAVLAAVIVFVVIPIHDRSIRTPAKVIAPSPTHSAECR